MARLNYPERIVAVPKNEPGAQEYPNPLIRSNLLYNSHPMDETTLPDRYNDGLVPPPEIKTEAERLAYPAWRPTAAQVEAARQHLHRDLAALALLVLFGLLGLDWLLGWRP